LPFALSFREHHGCTQSRALIQSVMLQSIAIAVACSEASGHYRLSTNEACCKIRHYMLDGTANIDDGCKRAQE